MTHELELKLLKEIEELRKENTKLKGIENDKVNSYKYHKIRDADLKKLFDIEKSLEDDCFNKWFNNEFDLDDDVLNFLEDLIHENKKFIQTYKEEDLKIKFITPILNRVKFKSIKNKFSDFYEEKLTYETDEFILTGTTDFLVSKGLFYSERPYFFIQEFKRSEDYSNPRPQLLAELISAVELNDSIVIKGAYIVGAIWNFIILERLSRHKYQYFVSENFDSSKIHDLKAIYKNLLFVKQEIIEMIERDE